MKNKRKFYRHERTYGPHFNEEFASKAVSYMKNGDGTNGAHWSLEQTTQIASQYGISLSTNRFNKYDWFVTMNMMYSDFYKAIISITNSDNIRYYVDLSKAWLEDKDIDKGKMWYYYKYIMCDMFREEDDDYDDEEYDEYYYSYPRRKRQYDRDDLEEDRYDRNSSYRRDRYMSRY